MNNKYWYNKEIPGYILVKWLTFPNETFAAIIPEFYIEVYQYFNHGATADDALNYFRNNINTGWQKCNHECWWQNNATIIVVNNEIWRDIPEVGW